MSVLTLDKVIYKYDGSTQDVLKNISADFEMGKVYAIVGKSGAGKSTLLSLIAGLDVPTEGAVLYKEQNLSSIDRDHYRAREIGVIFQSYNLLTNATAVENIVLSMNISNTKTANKESEAFALLKQMNIDAETAKRKILKLSGGQQQRVGIARALAHHPDIILADEPTGNLDGETEDEVLEILKKLAVDEGKCVIIITHSDKVAQMADVVLRLENGKVVA